VLKFQYAFQTVVYRVVFHVVCRMTIEAANRNNLNFVGSEPD